MAINKIMWTRVHDDAHAPTRLHQDDAGIDLRSRVNASISPGQTYLINTGIAVSIPVGMAGMVCSRSGLALKGVWVANAPGIIDPGYVGEVGVILHNSSEQTVEIESGDRIAQLLITPIVVSSLEEQEIHDFTKQNYSDRGNKGFGSTGKE